MNSHPPHVAPSLMRQFRFALRSLWRDLRAGELRVLALALLVAVELQLPTWAGGHALLVGVPADLEVLVAANQKRVWLVCRRGKV